MCLQRSRVRGHLKGHPRGGHHVTVAPAAGHETDGENGPGQGRKGGGEGQGRVLPGGTGTVAEGQGHVIGDGIVKLLHPAPPNPQTDRYVD